MVVLEGDDKQQQGDDTQQKETQDDKKNKKINKFKKKKTIVGLEELGFYTNTSHPSPHCTMWWERPQTLKLT